MSDESVDDQVVDADLNLAGATDFADGVEGAELPTDEVGDVSDASPAAEMTEEAIVALIAERDGYLDALQRLKAEFANARRRSEEQAAERRTQAAADLVEKILPVLDSCEAALGQGIDQVQPISDALFDVLIEQGLERLDPVGDPFDPELHEAVLYQEGDGGEQVVVETMRTGYRWNERILRAAMVKVQG